MKPHLLDAFGDELSGLAGRYLQPLRQRGVGPRTIIDEAEAQLQRLPMEHREIRQKFSKCLCLTALLHPFFDVLRRVKLQVAEARGPIWQDSVTAQRRVGQQVGTEKGEARAVTLAGSSRHQYRNG